jgi:hypothetical protein
MNYRSYLYPHPKPDTGVFTLILRTILFDGSTGFKEPIQVKVRGLTATSLLPALVIGGGTFYIRYSLPYIVKEIDAFGSRPYTPYLSFDQHSAYGCISVSPFYITGPFPSNTPFTFNVYTYIYGAPGQSVDFSTHIWNSLPSLPIVYRSYWSYYRLEDLYLFEDWIKVAI